MSEIERDREIDAAWRKASREEPPPALDEAIRAEARRAIGSAPGGARRSRAWRYPAAAAATVALLAFGIAQMTPREEIEPAVVSDQPSPGSRPPPAASPPVALPAPSTAQAPAPTATPAPRQLPERAMKPAPRKEQNAPTDRFAAAPETRAKLATDAAGEPPRAAASPGESAAPEPRRDEASREAYAPMQKGAAAAPGASANIQSRVIVGPQAVPAGRLSDFDDATAKQAGEQSVAAWIARIRELEQGGQADAAARELGRFRAAYGARADTLLPPDLRNIAPARP